MWRKAGRLDTAPCAQPGSLCAAQRKAGRQAGRPGSNVPPQRLHDLRQYEPLKMKSASAGGAGGQAGRAGRQAGRQAPPCGVPKHSVASTTHQKNCSPAGGQGGRRVHAGLESALAGSGHNPPHLPNLACSGQVKLVSGAMSEQTPALSAGRDE
jgi:hypothetical protein